jgi:hypothetical protein
MAHYFFHLRDGVDVLLDPEGCELPDLAAIVARTLVTARSILGAEALEGRIAFNMRLDVEDEAGAIVHSLPFADAVVIVPAH